MPVDIGKDIRTHKLKSTNDEQLHEPDKKIIPEILQSEYVLSRPVIAFALRE
jgi:hypothetical protein